MGQLLALDGNGDIVKSLKVGSELSKFDPRGVLFADDGRILISDASDPINIATAEDFVAVPKTVNVPLAVVAGLPLGLVCRRRRMQHGCRG